MLANRTGQGSAESFFPGTGQQAREQACPFGLTPDLRFDDLHHKVVDGAVHFLEPVGNSRWYHDNVAL